LLLARLGDRFITGSFEVLLADGWNKALREIRRLITND